jgi:hypothetical protein
MPILAPEIDLFPMDLLDREEWPEDQGHRWWALYTRSRCEKELMRRLLMWEIPFYGPTIEKRGRTPQGRIRAAMIPLFKNYVFLYGDGSQRHAAVTTNCVSRDIPVFDGPQLALDLRQLRRALQLGLPVNAESQLEPGTRVRVRSGPLHGYEGTVICRRGETRLLVAVQFLQQGVSMQIDDCDLEPLS